ncbi:MAG: class I SAM-dependent methyltransferase [Paracoccaceae bacterium]
MGFFDFIDSVPGYDARGPDRLRLNARHDMLIGRHRGQISAARVLDLAAHDGRWSYAFAGAGAVQVVGIEARPELITRFPHFPDAGLKARVELRCADVHDGVEAAKNAGEHYDVVAVFGIFYHIMDHFRLLRGIHALKPRLVIIDSEFVDASGPMIRLIRERTDNRLNAAAQFPGQQVAVKGVPSFRALETMADVLGFSVDWMDWGDVPPCGRRGLGDYYRAGDMRRATCVLRPGRMGVA